MRLFFSGPRILGIRPGISFGAEDLFGSRRRSGGQLPPADDGYLFGGLPGIIKWPLRIIVSLICCVIILSALSLLFAILNL
jgi:hypothetical protein